MSALADQVWYPLSSYGISEPYTAINVATVISTWYALGVLVLFVFCARFFVRPAAATPITQEDGSQEIEISWIQYGRYSVLSVIEALVTFVEQSSNTFVLRYYVFISSLFLFILSCNWVALLPFAEEPTQDLNTTIALGLITLVYIQKEKINAHGIKHFLREYFLPIATFFPLNIIIGIAHLPLKLLGELASVISLSFRLFGNIYGGAIINAQLQNVITGSFFRQALVTLTGITLGLNIFFVLFEGALQAFVFSILALTNLAMATSEEGLH